MSIYYLFAIDLGYKIVVFSKFGGLELSKSARLYECTALQIFEMVLLYSLKFQVLNRKRSIRLIETSEYLFREVLSTGI